MLCQEAFVDPKRPPRRWLNVKFCFLLLQSWVWAYPLLIHRTVWWSSPDFSLGQGFLGNWEQVMGCLAWQAFNWMSIVSLQVGALKRDSIQSQTVWNNQVEKIIVEIHNKVGLVKCFTFSQKTSKAQAKYQKTSEINLN